jgi:hypothetical protein
MADDLLAATLAGIRERAEAAADFPLAEIAEWKGPDSIGGWIAASALDVPRLLKAVDAALKLHQPGRIAVPGSLCKRHESHRFFSITSTEADGVRACRGCTATVYSSCTGCGLHVSADACPARCAITAELTRGEVADHG